VLFARLPILACLAVVTGLGAASSADAQPLPVTRCDPAANSCSGAAPSGPATPALGGAGRVTLLSPSRRATEVALGTSSSRVPVPGCDAAAPGVLRCGTINEYQHCRTLMISAMVDSCRIEMPFVGLPVEARPASPGSYQLTVESDARVRIVRGERAFSQVRGKADALLQLELPAEARAPAWCVQRDRFQYSMTGSGAGVPDIGDSADCAEPIEIRFTANDDDALRAYDRCEIADAWGEELEDTIEIFVAGLFHIRSASPAFAARYPGGEAVVAEYVTVTAPFEIDCRD
jgi:hypothetical protein